MRARYWLLLPLVVLIPAGVYSGQGQAAAQGGPPQGPVAPPSTVTNPPRDFSPRGAPTTYFWDPDIIAVDPSFNDLAQKSYGTYKRLVKETGLVFH